MPPRAGSQAAPSSFHASPSYQRPYVKPSVWSRCYVQARPILHDSRQNTWSPPVTFPGLIALTGHGVAECAGTAPVRDSRILAAHESKILEQGNAKGRSLSFDGCAGDPLDVGDTRQRTVQSFQRNRAVFVMTNGLDRNQVISFKRAPAGGNNASAISSYAVDVNGTLTAISLGVPTLGNANCWNAVTGDGRFVYLSNAGSSTISGFAIGPTGALTAIGATVVGTNPAGARISTS